MDGLRTACAVAAAMGICAGAAIGQARIGLGGVRSGQPRTNGFQGGPPLPPMAPIQTRGGNRGGGSRIGFPRSTSGGGRFQGSTDTGFFNGSRGFVEGSGVHLDGRFADDNFRLKFHLGSDLGMQNRFHHDGDWRHDGNWHDNGHEWWRRHHWPRNTIIWPYYYNYGSDYIGWPYGDYYDPYLTQPISYYQPPAPPEQPPADPPTARELGDTALFLNEPTAAIDAYRRHLDDSPEDAEVMRRLGVAMIDARNTRDGVAMIALAYRTDPRLCGQQLAADIVGGAVDLRNLVNRVSIYANNVGSASAWLSMAALVQAEGRLDVAVRMVERARAAGIDPALADRFVATLGPGAAPPP